MGALIDHRQDQQFYRNAYAKVNFTRDDVDWESLADIYARAPLAVRSAAEIKRAFANSYLCCFARIDGQLVGAARAMSNRCVAMASSTRPCLCCASARKDSVI